MSVGLMVWAAAVQPAAAHNNLLLPGDAFFPALAPVLLEASGDVVLQYEILSNGAMGCGNAGFSQLRVLDLSAADRQALQQAIRSAVALGTEEHADYGPESVVVLGYARSASLDGVVLGQRYNETIREDEARSGHEARAPVLEGEDLKAAQTIPPLPLVNPDLPYAGLMGAEVPQEVPASAMQWVVTDRYALWRQGSGALTVWVVSGDAVTQQQR